MKNPRPTDNVKDLEYQKRIAWGQAMNCAVDILNPIMRKVAIAKEDGKTQADQLKESLISWRDWFYQELMKPYEVEEKVGGVCPVCGGVSDKEGLVNGIHPSCHTDQKMKMNDYLK